jgi:HSP20 family molecular chaperone IbpA
LEIDYGGFSRDIELPPSPICVEGVRTQFRNGILAIVLPKMAQSHVTVVIEESIILTKV